MVCIYKTNRQFLQVWELQDSTNKGAEHMYSSDYACLL